MSSQFEMGRGSYNGIAKLVAEELDADWSTIEVLRSAGDVKSLSNLTFGAARQATGGSTSMFTSRNRHRQAGAATVEHWDVPPSSITVANGVLSHSSGKQGGFGEFTATAAKLPIPSTVTLPKPTDWELLGKGNLKRFYSAHKTNGTESDTLDVKLPGMLTAVMVHPPLFGAKVKSFHATDHVADQSIMAKTLFEGMVKGGVVPTSVEGVSNLPYTIPNQQIGWTTVGVGVPVVW